MNDLVTENYRFADTHYLYCKSICVFDHTEICKELAKLHNRSFVRCKSHYCIKYNDRYGYSITHEKPVLQKDVSLYDMNDMNGILYLEDDEDIFIEY